MLRPQKNTDDGGHSREHFSPSNFEKILGYGSLGVASATIIYFTSGFGGSNLLLQILGIILWIAVSSTMAWTLWEFALPMAGREEPNDRDR